MPTQTLFRSAHHYPPSLYLLKMFFDIPRSQTDRGPAAPRHVLRLRRGIRDRGPGRHDRWPVADVDIRDCEHASSAVHAVGDGDGGFVDSRRAGSVHGVEVEGCDGCGAGD